MHVHNKEDPYIYIIRRILTLALLRKSLFYIKGTSGNEEEDTYIYTYMYIIRRILTHT